MILGDIPGSDLPPMLSSTLRLLFGILGGCPGSAGLFAAMTFETWMRSITLRMKKMWL